MEADEGRDLPEGYQVSFKRKHTSESTRTEILLDVKLAVHPGKNGVIVINYPGANGDIDGYKGKYVTLGNFLQEKLGAVVRTDNTVHGGLRYDVSVKEHLRCVIDYVLRNAKDIAGKDAGEVTIYLMGFSAGGSAVAAVAHEYQQVRKILLLAPSSDAGMETVAYGLQRYTGECYIVVGNNDEVVGRSIGGFFASLANSAYRVRNVVIQNCDHEFRGVRNGKIMSAAPLWAFSGAATDMPSPDDGVKLYD